MKYFAIVDGEQIGPLSLHQLADAGVGPDTYVWHKGLDDWQLARTDAEICREFRRRVTDLLHPGSAPAQQNGESFAGDEEDPFDQVPIRFRKMVRNSGFVPGPADTQKPDYSKRPPNLLPAAILVTILCFPFTGLLAIFSAAKSLRSWKKGNAEEAYEYTRMAKMWTGITFFLGFIVMALGIAQVYMK